MTKARAAVSWSGGKDCALALHRARARFDIVGLLTVFTADGSRTRSHGLRPEVIRAQAEALDLPLLTTDAAWSSYEARFERLLNGAKHDWHIDHVIFGDVFPDAHKRWTEGICGRAGLAAFEPLWGESTAALSEEFIAGGGRAKIVAAREDRLGEAWLGREIDHETLDALRGLGVDPGGENGEFHTVVTHFPDGGEIALHKLGTRAHGGCRLLDLTLAHPSERSSLPSAES
ncbi:MAG: adenosine nucleotide hydrolase [Gammaproteobacteria bacterium]